MRYAVDLIVGVKPCHAGEPGVVHALEQVSVGEAWRLVASIMPSTACGVSKRKKGFVYTSGGAGMPL